MNDSSLDLIKELESVIDKRRRLDPHESYVAKMLKGPDAELYRKIPEEAIEVLLACTVGGELADEIADLWFHTLLVMAKHNVSVDEVIEVLKNRRQAPADMGD